MRGARGQTGQVTADACLGQPPGPLAFGPRTGTEVFGGDREFSCDRVCLDGAAGQVASMGERVTGILRDRLVVAGHGQVPLRPVLSGPRRRMRVPGPRSWKARSRTWRTISSSWPSA
jgi:hypothetical protein